MVPGPDTLPTHESAVPKSAVTRMISFPRQGPSSLARWRRDGHQGARDVITGLRMRRCWAFAIGTVLLGACVTPAATPSVVPSTPPSTGSQIAPTPSTQTSSSPVAVGPVALQLREFDVPAGSHPHDVAPAADGGVSYTGQRTGVLGHLDPATGDIREIQLGAGSAPHGVITGPDGAAWITDSGRNAIIRVDGETDAVRAFDLPADRPDVNLNTAVFDASGTLWFTGQAGIYGRLDPPTGEIAVFDDPEGRGPYGIAVTPGGEIWYASLAGSHIARVETATGAATVVEPPTARQGARRVWSDSRGRIWVSEWDAGQVAVHDPAT